MKAGRQLDMLIAEKVFGWTHCSIGLGGAMKQSFEDAFGYPPQKPLAQLPSYVPHFSTEADPALRVLNKMRQAEYPVIIQGAPSYSDPAFTSDTPWRVCFSDLGKKPFPALVPGSELPHAICLAALKALGVEVPA